MIEYLQVVVYTIEYSGEWSVVSPHAVLQVPHADPITLSARVSGGAAGACGAAGGARGGPPPHVGGDTARHSALLMAVLAAAAAVTAAACQAEVCTAYN